jgi:hypothetical protein
MEVENSIKVEGLLLIDVREVERKRGLCNVCPDPPFPHQANAERGTAYPSRMLEPLIRALLLFAIPGSTKTPPGIWSVRLGCP